MNAIVTGATKGIGRALVELLAAKGANVVFCARTAADVQALAEDLRGRYPEQRFWGLAADMSKREAVLDFADAALSALPQIDLLVNNAGIFLPCDLTDPEGEAAFEGMMRTNVFSAYYLTRKLLPRFIEQTKGHIVQMCSIASFMPYGAYAVSKHALLGFSRVLRQELRDKGVRVTAVMPGATYTPSWGGTSLPESRFMSAQDIAQAVWDVHALSHRTVVEEIVLRPQLGDI